MNDLCLSRLTALDSLSLSKLLRGDEESYVRYFSPFNTDIKTIKAILDSAHKDCYWGFWFKNTLVGFFMLRGFDAGYERPAFGVYISKNYSNHGLSKVALEYSMCWCKLNHIRSMMLKVHSENFFAKKTYEEAGFRFTEICPNSGHQIMEISWG